MKTTKSKKPLSFTVKLSKWRCGGEGPNQLGKGKNTLLLNNEGFKCCLGFACRAAGYKGKMRTGMPNDLPYVIRGLSYLAGGDKRATEFSNKAQTINDDRCTTVEEKIKELKRLGKEHSISIKFIK